MSNNWEIGDKVFCFKYGFGIIKEIRDGLIYPLTVKFKNETSVFTKEGKSHFKNKRKSLFFVPRACKKFLI